MFKTLVLGIDRGRVSLQSVFFLLKKAKDVLDAKKKISFFEFLSPSLYNSFIHYNKFLFTTKELFIEKIPIKGKKKPSKNGSF